ncbi:MAG: nucleotidyl transferase AbiEii/AbiGii toxin family protein [bacterium]
MFLEVLHPEQLRLLNRLSEIKEISEAFYLAGGTALAMQLGHRESVDLDFFSEIKFNPQKYERIIIKDFGGTVSSISDDTINGEINNIFISFFFYPYKLLKDFQKYLNINLASIEDLACMKCKAISQRNTKRDFYDIFEILKKMQLLELKNYLLEKFNVNGTSFYHLNRSLLYFEEAEKNSDPISLNGTTWKEVKNYFIKNQFKLLKTFS